MNKTKIEWVKNPDGTQGYTWNPITGCLNGCSYCYARKLANGRLKQRYLANKNVARWHKAMLGEYGFKALGRALTDPFYPRFWPKKLKELPDVEQWNFIPSKGRNKILRASSRKPRGIFVCDMSDLFGKGIPEEWTLKVLNAIRNDPYDRFYLLTKQPQNLIKFSPFPENCWVGVTATNQAMYDSAVYWLNQTEAKVRFISIEPFLSHIHLPNYKDADWLIIGSQTKPYKPPKIEWVREIVEACDKAGVPVFLKDNLRPLLKNKDGWTPAWAVGARSCDGIEYLRQEMPNLYC